MAQAAEELPPLPPPGAPEAQETPEGAERPVPARDPERPKTPLGITFSSHAAFAAGTRSAHGSFGATLGSQHLGRERPGHRRTFTSLGASAYTRAYLPSGQIGCGRDAEPKPSPRVCPTGWSVGPTVGLGEVKDRDARWTVPDERLRVSFTPFLGVEPLRATGQRGLAGGARLTLSGTFTSLGERMMDDTLAKGSGQGAAMAMLLVLPAFLVNHYEVYGETLVVQQRAYTSVGGGLGFGF